MMKLLNTLTGKYDEFTKESLDIYICGPTVYNYIHIGNARPVVLVDTLIRYLEYRGVKVNYLMNITDIDDKIIDKAIKEKVSEEDIANKFTEAYLEDLESLNVQLPNKISPISKKINEILDFISLLIEKDAAYEVNGDVYFDIEKYKEQYGKLSHHNIGDDNSVARVERDNNKRNPGDFVLWKKTEIGKKWYSRFSEGRPGWHTECVGLIDDYFGHTIDIHVGGIDLKFPHHENERIQYWAKAEAELSNIWLHNGHVTVGSEKMSKSLGNTILVRDFVKEHGANALRFIFMNTTFTQPINITDEVIKNASNWVSKINTVLKKINWMSAIGECVVTNETPIDDDFNSMKYFTKFSEMVEDNLNTPMIISLIDEMVKNLNKQISNKSIDKTFDKLLKILRISGFNFSVPEIDGDTKIKIIDWKHAIREKNFEVADKLRSELTEMGIL